MRPALRAAPVPAAEIDRPSRSRRRHGDLRYRLERGALPYALLAPTALVLVAVLGYPLYKLLELSFQRYGLFQLLAHRGEWIGLANYSRILHDGEFWRIVLRTVAFTLVNVGLTMTIGTLIALLLVQMSAPFRLLLTTGLVWVWATPVIVGVAIWQWMVDYEFGVANWTLTQLHIGHFTHHNWFANPLTGFAVITACVVWGAIPFVTITIYAGLAQLPQELVEAAWVDGAKPRQVFFRIVLPILKPIFVILVSLSTIWDFQVFNQVWVMLDERPTSDYFLLSIYSFFESFRVSQYGLGSAIAVVMVLLMLGVTFVYVRQMVRIGEAE